MKNTIFILLMLISFISYSQKPIKVKYASFYELDTTSVSLIDPTIYYNESTSKFMKYDGSNYSDIGSSIGNASISLPGLVSTSSQTFGGTKTFNNGIVSSSYSALGNMTISSSSGNITLSSGSFTPTIILGGLSGSVRFGSPGGTFNINLNYSLTEPTSGRGQLLIKDIDNNNVTKFDISSGEATLNFPSTNASSVSELTVNVNGASTGDVVLLGVPIESITTTGTYSAYVSSSGIVTIRYSPKATEDPASGLFKVQIIKQ